MIIIYICAVINSLRHDPCFLIIWTPFLLVKELHSIMYLFMMLQRIYIRKGKHFYWLAVENYVDKDSAYCLFLSAPCYFRMILLFFVIWTPSCWCDRCTLSYIYWYCYSWFVVPNSSILSGWLLRIIYTHFAISLTLGWDNGGPQQQGI